MRKTVLAVVFIALQLTAHAEPEIKGTATELAQYISGIPKNVSVIGEAEVRVPAHKAVLTLRVTTENRSLQEAFRSNLDLRSKIADQLKKQGISPDRIVASKFSSTPKYGIFSDKAKGYRVENVMRVTVQDEKEFQGATAIVDAYPEVQFGGVEFQYADREALKQQAIGKAIDNAGERAKVYGEKLALKLTPVAFTDNSVLPMNSMAPNASDGLLTSGLRSTTPANVLPEESISSFGELVYTARVSVEYSVQAK
jgi:uncharacterized protein YggE